MSDQLIYAMSTRGVLGISQFNDAYKAVYVPQSLGKDDELNLDTRRQLIRMLDSLGYCEFNFEGRRVSMCKPAFVLLPSHGLPKALLVGARTPHLLDLIKNALKKRNKIAALSIKWQRGTSLNVPATVCIEAISKEIIEEIARETEVAHDLTEPAAWKLINYSADINAVLSDATFQIRQELNWKHRYFNPERLVFSGIDGKREEICLAEYKNPIDMQIVHWFWRGSEATQIQRDWGRFKVLSDLRKNILLYDEKHLKLGIPVTVSLPCILARSIALCSGLPPVFTETNTNYEFIPEGHPLHIYENVPHEIAAIVARKLGQNLVKTELLKT